MFDIVLYQPEIPPNTGNIIRLCANTGCHLHLIEPLGFEMDDQKLKRAGLDYHEFADLRIHHSLDDMPAPENARSYAFSTRGTAHYSDVDYLPGDALVFGPETRGLPQEYLSSLPPDRVLRIPMLEHSRSLNLSNAVAVVVYEALRQAGFRGML